ncbi:MAG TPA: RDD family protein [Candidatus Onthousia faecipullorum]|uniref:RDD family protein n=1 Tax=Candidatus Onthousia faecipullorum TaxID=2840887 RepID=A0A9D1KBB8_9FIRM|nr:RDD family protein [Candidatus Onthousia faecipullorum]
MKKKSVYDKIKDEEEKLKEENKVKKSPDIKAMFSQRVLAFIIDFFILGLISSLIIMFVPVSETASKLYEEQNKILMSYSEGTVSMEEYVNQLIDLEYDIAKQTVIVSIVTIVISILYYVVYPCYNNGQTLGKKLMKIKIKKTDDTDLSMNDLLIRGMINNSILVNIISIILVLFLSKDLYLSTSSLLNIIQYLVLIISLIMIAFTKNAQGLHDKVCKTEVVVADTVKEDVLCTSGN